MDHLVTMTTQGHDIPAGTTVDDAIAREALRAHELPAAAHSSAAHSSDPASVATVESSTS
jgi:hypothetical protein